MENIDYAGDRVSDATHVKALRSETRYFIAFSGDAVLIRANSLEEAEAKYEAMNLGTDCPCGVSPECVCIDDWETLTHIEETQVEEGFFSGEEN